MNRTLVVLVGLIVCTTAAGAGVGVSVAHAPMAGPPVEFDVTTPASSVQPGDRVQVRVHVDTHGRSVYALSATLSYDPDDLSLVDASTGPFLSQGVDEVLVVADRTDPTAGVLERAHTRVGRTGTSGAGAYLDLEFVVDESAAGNDTVVGIDAAQAVNASERTVPSRTEDLTLSVGAADSDDGGDGGGGGGGGLPGGDPGEVEITDRTLLNDTVAVGEPVLVGVDLANRDPARGQLTLTMSAEGGQTIERTVAVAASTRRTVYLRTRFDSPGRYTLSVGGVPVGTVTVEASATSGTSTPQPTETTTQTTAATGVSESDAGGASTDTERPPTTAGDGDGFGVVVALAAVGLALLATRRRRG